MKIGIGITTAKTLIQIKKLSPDAKVFVGDDKIKCLAALDDCNYIFLFDDGYCPTEKGWHEIFIAQAIETQSNILRIGKALFLTNYSIRVLGGNVIDEPTAIDSGSSFKPYRKDNFVCSIYLLGAKRKSYGNFNQHKNINLLRKWAESLLATGLTGILFHNCFTRNEQDLFYGLPVKFIKVEPPKVFQSGLYRYELYHNFIKDYSGHIDNIFFTDSTDLEFLKNPTIQKNFDTDKIYIGCEPVVCGNKWMMGACHGYEKYLHLVRSDKQFASHPLLNAGFCGGSLKAIAPFIERMAAECIMLYDKAEWQDMPIINYLAYTEFKDKVVFGSEINTVFTLYEKNNKVAWIKHK